MSFSILPVSPSGASRAALLALASILAPTALAKDPAAKSGSATPAAEPIHVAIPHPDATPYAPVIKAASDEGQKAIERFEYPEGMTVSLVAAEPMLANPVCFTIDHKGRFFVAETFRHHDGVTDMRDHRRWLMDDLECRTVDDRLHAMAKNLGLEFMAYSMHHDRIRMLEDTDGDGVADRDTVFADGFNHALDGIGAGLLMDRGQLFWTCLPHVWRLRDGNGDGVVDRMTMPTAEQVRAKTPGRDAATGDERESLSYGYGVHNNFLGHDLHGLVKGPDGRIYFSIGDRGLHVTTREGKLIDLPDTGAVLRCRPDGSELEVFHTGLRNPQELAFDDYGNLFTGDNNSDAGDKARLVYLVEGGETGWTIGWQWLEKPRTRGPWNSEKMWAPMHDGTPAYLLPPIDNFTSGPSGFTYYPGTGLGDEWAGNFFLCDFRGNAGTSLIHALELNPRGAWFSLGETRQFLKGSLATDCDFGMEGGLYLTDWTQGWDQPRKGRIYRIAPPGIEDDPLVVETKRLLGEGMRTRANEELIGLLGHADRRVRFEAQWELADRGGSTDRGATVVAALADVAAKAPIVEGMNPIERMTALNDRATRLPRLHALWALGQIADPPKAKLSSAEREAREAAVEAAFAAIRERMGDPDHEVRAHAMRLVGDLIHAKEDRPALTAALKDSAPRVRYFAAVSLGKTFSLAKRAKGEAREPEDDAAVDALCAMLDENANKDPYLRHAGVMGLAGVAAPGRLMTLAESDPRAPVRMAALLAIRRTEADRGKPVFERLARLLNDADPQIVAEAARAIHDVPFEPALGALAAFANAPSESVRGADDANIRNPIFLRALNVSYRAGDAAGAERVATFAADATAPEDSRLEALWMLRDWDSPKPTDRIIGLYRPVEARSGDVAAAALRGRIVAILGSGTKADGSASDAIVEAAAEAAGRYQLAEAAPALAAAVADASRETAARVAALKALGAMADVAGADLQRAVAAARLATKADLRSEGNTQLARLDPAAAVAVFHTVLESGEVAEKQGAVRSLAEMARPEADAMLRDWLDRMAGGAAPAEIQFELIEAAARRAEPAMLSSVERWKAGFPADDPLGAHRAKLAGGNAANGEKAFFDKTEAQCGRCHIVGGRGGGEAGPDLSKVREQGREHILESILKPNAKIAVGYENVTLKLADGSEVAGRVVEETDEALTLEIAVEEEAKLVAIDAEDEFDDPGEAPKPAAAESKGAEGDSKAHGAKEGSEAAKPEAAAPKKYERRVVPRGEIAERARNVSSMPEDVSTHLTEAEIRDIVEFLATRP